jgi:protein TonB
MTFHWLLRKNNMVLQGSNSLRYFALGRWLVAMLIATLATFAVFWMMQGLISSGNSVVNKESFGRLTSFVDVSQDDDVQTKARAVVKPPVAQEEPEIPQMAQASARENSSNAFDLGGLDISTDLSIDAGLNGAATSDGDYLPIVKVAPQYPRRALKKGIEGYVTLEFTVTTLGTVIDPVVIDSKPKNVFDRAAINAAKKFKYKPKVVDGKAQQVTGVRNIIRFEMDKGKKK